MVDHPVVSVCLITYNQAPYVKLALESILAQDFVGPWEIVIADDVSSDGTQDILKDYSLRFPNLIRILDRPKNLGPGPNFIDLLLQAKGKYIAYLEGDDYWTDPSKLSKQVAYLDAHPSTVLTWHNYHIIDEHNHIITSDAAANSKKNYNASELKQINSIKSLTICFRNIIRQFPDNYLDCPNGDTFLYVLLAAHGGANFLSEIKPSCYRIHSAGTWSLITQLKKDQKASKSYFEIAKYLCLVDDLQGSNYYIDRLVKSMYVIALHHRIQKNWWQFVNSLLITLYYVVRFRKWKWLPAVFSYFSQMAKHKQLKLWQHRVGDVNDDNKNIS
jgi:glycosyltransferase involved in cell wall biosynthesis